MVPYFFTTALSLLCHCSVTVVTALSLLLLLCHCCHCSVTAVTALSLLSLLCLNGLVQVEEEGPEAV